MTHSFRPRLITSVLMFALSTGWAATARAQSFISPLIGFNFGGDAACPNITGCEDKRLNYGVSLGKMGSVFGFEEEFAFANNFFGTAPSLKSNNVLTLMSNVMFVPKIGPIRPYGLAGLGLIRTHVEPTVTSLVTAENSNFGWDLGGGVIVGGEHIGIRGDIRYFHTFSSQTILIPQVVLSNAELNFGRASVALMLMF
jgi:opacity protein-like surface antigen